MLVSVLWKINCCTNKKLLDYKSGLEIKMRKILLVLFNLLMLPFLYSCKESASDKITHLVNEWESREIIYPAQMYFTKLGQDTISAYPILNRKYSIVTYVDSIGCTSCKLQLRKWMSFIVELDSLMKPSIPVYFFLHPKNRSEIVTILNRSHFDYPVCIDEKDSLNLLNHFPQDMSFQTFLLNKDNKVIAIGNPILNPKIKDLYFNILLDKSGLEKEKQVPITKITISEQMIDMGNFSWKSNQEKEVTIKNVGQSPLVIDEVLASCGCLTIEYNKKPVLPKDSTCVKIRYQAEYPEHFNKTITIYCNGEGAPLKLRIAGNAN